MTPMKLLSLFILTLEIELRYDRVVSILHTEDQPMIGDDQVENICVRLENISLTT